MIGETAELDDLENVEPLLLLEEAKLGSIWQKRSVAGIVNDHVTVYRAIVIYGFEIAELLISVRIT